MRRNETLVANYVRRLKEEASELHARFPYGLKTLYFGGGTPSHLTDAELEDIIHHLYTLWGRASLETTLEADPLTFDKARLRHYKHLGINRLSIGLQSTQDHVLSFLGRSHKAKQGLEAISMALEEGLEVSADLITGMVMQDTAQDLHALAQTGVKHISVYSLTIEPFTPFALRKIQVNEDKDADDYESTQQILQTYGFERYEVSNHAKPGHESKHNQIYWHGDYFLALGPSAASFVPAPAVLGLRQINPPIKDWLQGKSPEIIPIDPLRYSQDLLMTALRTQKGLNLEVLVERTQLDVFEIYPLLPNLLEAQWLILEYPYLRASEQGLMQLNGVLRALF